MSKLKVDGAWRTPAITRVKVDGVWRLVSVAYVKVDGVWRISTLAGAPAVPTLQHTGYGQFTITNYDPALTYTLTLVSGGGTANRVGAVITLSNVNARFSITAAYAAGATQSTAGFFERKAYTYTEEFYDCYYTQDPCGSCPGGWWCGDFGWTRQCCNVRQIKNPTPSGYTDQFGEWARVA